jgi:hypothetical protein
LEKRWLYCEGETEFLFTENETNSEKLFDVPNSFAYVKDGINDYIVHGKQKSVNPEKIGTKVVANYLLTVGTGETKTIRLRLSDVPNLTEAFGENFDRIFSQKQKEADDFY